MKSGPHPLELKIPPLVVLALGAGIAWGLDRLLPELAVALPGQQIVGRGLLALCVALMLTAVVGFQRARTTMDPTRPDRAERLVTGGIFRVSRNPVYLAMATLLAGVVVKLGNPLGAVALIGFVLYLTRFQIIPEERALTAKFGETYEAYRTQVRRWI